jgi:hypothetical protein
MFISYKNTQEKIEYMKEDEKAAITNSFFLLETLEQMNKKSERYENLILSIAEIYSNQEKFNEKTILEEIKKIVKPVCEEVANRNSSNSPMIDKDYVPRKMKD